MVAAPEKEIRFTRARQAQPWLISGALALFSVLLWLTAVLLPVPYGAPELIQYWYFILPLVALACVCYKLAIHCIKHAYLIFTPLGVEIFPFRKPEKNLNVIYWQEIDSIEIRDSNLYIHFNKEKTAGSVVSLKPIKKTRLTYLNQLVEHKNKDTSN